MLEDTVIAFVSDHGDQLGEHNLFRKAFPYQGSIHIPLIIHDRKFSSLSKESFNGKQIDRIVELMDILPTLVELGTGEKVQEIDGKSLVSLMENKTTSKKKEIREFLHGEHEMGVYSSQYILTEEWKYIWYSYTGEEQLFHLFSDKNEEVNLINEKKYEKIVSKLRKYLIESLSGREEGYVEKGKLKAVKTAKPTLSFLKNHI